MCERLANQVDLGGSGSWCGCQEGDVEKCFKDQEKAVRLGIEEVLHAALVEQRARDAGPVSLLNGWIHRFVNEGANDKRWVFLSEQIAECVKQIRTGANER